MKKNVKIQGRKGITVENAMWILMIMILDAFIFALYIKETVKNANVLNILNNAFIAQGFLDYVMHNSCILAKNEKDQRIPFVVNISFLKANNGKDLQCLNLDNNIKYNLMFFVPSFFKTTIGGLSYVSTETYNIKNTDKQFSKAIDFYMIDQYHRPVIMEVKFINYTNPKQSQFKKYVFSKTEKTKTK